jgi:hypothetical protein
LILLLKLGGADGIAARSLKKIEEKPLNSSVYCPLLIFPMSLRNPLRFFGQPYNALFWQQLATVVDGSVRRSAMQRGRYFPDRRLNQASRRRTLRVRREEQWLPDD